MKEKLTDVDILLQKIQNEKIEDNLYRYLCNYDLSEECIQLLLPKIIEKNEINYLLQYQNNSVNTINLLIDTDNRIVENSYLYSDNNLNDALIIELWDKLNIKLLSSQLKLSEKIMQKIVNECDDKYIYTNLACLQNLSGDFILNNIDKFKKYKELFSILLEYQSKLKDSIKNLLKSYE